MTIYRNIGEVTECKVRGHIDPV